MNLRVTMVVTALGLSTAALGDPVGVSRVAPAATPATAPTTITVGLPAASTSVTPTLRQGTEVRFSTVEPLSSANSKEGDRFELKSVEDTKVGQLLVIPAGSRAVGEVTRVVKKGAFGKSGKIDARILYVVVGDNHISMTGKANDSGTAGTGGVVAAAVLFWPVMPFITGTSANLPAGTKLSGFVENDIPLVAASAPAPAPLAAPMIVPVVATSAPVVPPQPAAAPAAPTKPNALAHPSQ